MYRTQAWLWSKLQEHRQKLRTRKGFTLIELIVVVVIIAVLVMLAAPDFAGTIFQTKITACESDIKTIGDAVTKYYIELGELPPVSSMEDLKTELVRDDIEIDGRKYGPWVKENMNTKDPWNQEFTYEDKGGRKFDICSSGPPDDPKEICYSKLGRKRE